MENQADFERALAEARAMAQAKENGEVAIANGEVANVNGEVANVNGEVANVNNEGMFDTLKKSPSPTEGFSNLRWNGIQLDLVLKAIFFGCLFYLLSQPELYKMTKKCCKKVDGVLLHAIVFAVLYFIVIHFI